jgi:hypothetical protein
LLKFLLEFTGLLVFRWISLDYKENFVRGVYKTKSESFKKKPEKSQNYLKTKKNGGLCCDKKQKTQGKHSTLDEKSEGKNASQTKSVDKTLKEVQKQKRKEFKLSFMDKIKDTIFCGGVRNSRVQKLDSAMKFIQKKIDLIYLVKKLFELEKIKMLLLDENQRCLLNYIPNCKMVSSKTPEKNMSKHFGDEKILGSSNSNSVKTSVYLSKDPVSNAERAFEEIAKKKNKTPTDLRLLSLIEKNNLEGFFETFFAPDIFLVKEEEEFLEKQINIPHAFGNKPKFNV